MTMLDSNYVYAKGTLMVAPGGGGAFTPLDPGAVNQALFADPSSPLGVAWGAGSAMGDVVGPGSSTAHHLAAFADTSGELLEDSGILTANVALGAGSSTMGNIVSFASTDGKTMADSGIVAANVALGIASATDDRLARFNGAGGKQLDQAAGTTLSDTDVMTFPANGGTVYTAGATKGSFTLNGSGTHAKILTASAVTGCVIVFTMVNLNGDAAPSSLVAVIDTGVGFTPTSSNATAAAIVNWAIVA